MSLFAPFVRKSTINKIAEEAVNDSNSILLDVRTREEYKSGHIPGSINIPLDELSAINIEKNKKLYVYCLSGGRSASACSLLKKHGYDVENIGGISSYTGKVEKGVMTMKVLIIGGVAGGATAAARLRRLDEKAEIIILERSGYISYANCGLPYYIGGVIKNKANLTLQTPESFWIRFRIDVRVRNEAIAIDAVNKTVTVRRLDDGSEYTETYDKLILSPGAKAIRPGFPGIDDKRIFTLRTVEDTFAIHDYIETASPKSAVVVGGGFIGLEMAENLINSGIDTTLIQLDDHVMTPVDYDMACEIHSYLRGKGLTLRLGETVESFESNGSSITTHIKDRQSVNSDMVVLAIGVTPESALAKTAGLKLGIKESISVDNHMRTSVPDIYAVGDAVEITNTVTGEKSLISLAGPANKQGRVAADNICGIDSTFDGAQGSSIIKLFDMTVAATGINEKNGGSCRHKI